MGKRKMKLGRVWKNEERRRQAMKVNKSGRPKKCKNLRGVPCVEQVITLATACMC